MQMSTDCMRPHSGLNSEADEVNEDSLMTQEIAKVHSMQVYLQQSIVFKQTELSQMQLRHAK